MDETQWTHHRMVSSTIETQLQHHQKLQERHGSTRGYIVRDCTPDECAAGEFTQMTEVIADTSLMLVCIALAAGYFFSVWNDKRKNRLNESFDRARDRTE